MMGMLKRNLLELMELERSFTRLRETRTHAAESAGPAGGGSPAGRRRGSATCGKGGSAKELAAPPPLDEHCVYASDLVRTLGISEAEAEEMIFIADFKDNQAIDFSEFKQIVVNWTS